MTIRRASDIDEVRQWASVAARAADDKQGADIVVLEVGPVLAITDAFVITSASNTRQVRTIAEEVELQVRSDEIVIRAARQGKARRWNRE